MRTSAHSWRASFLLAALISSATARRGSIRLDAWALAASLAPGTALAFLLVEHRWAQPLFDAIAATGGMLVGEGFLTQEAGLLVGAEIAAMEEAARVIEAAQAAEAEAVLLALAAEADAAEAVAASEVIRAAAAADAVRALISAGLVEETAAHEAIEALSAAGIIVTNAGEAATEAVAEAASRIKAASITMEQARVLRYLPTQLSFGVIADKLGITRSAAKERAERLYKKLDVHSRRRSRHPSPQPRDHRLDRESTEAHRSDE